MLAASNPHGVAQVYIPADDTANPRIEEASLLYIVDNASQNIYILGANELNGLSDGAVHTLDREPFDLAATLGSVDWIGEKR